MEECEEFVHLSKYGSLLVIRPVVINELRHILIPVKSQISVYDSQSFGHLWDFNINCGKITSICSIVDNENWLLVATNIGQILIYDLSKQLIIKSENIGRYIRSIISIGGDKVILVSCPLNYRINPLCKYKISITNLCNIMVSFTTIGNSRLSKRQQCSYSHTHKCFIIADKKRLRTLFVEDLTKRIVIKGTLEVSCVSIHPSEAIYAVGYTNGAIKLYNIEDNSLIANFHWHSNPVSDIGFSTDGSHLYSGGLETVLVCWNLKEQSKHFLPRLGAEIKYLTVSESTVCLIHYNNDVSIVSSLDFKLIKTIVDYQRTLDTLQLLWDKKSETILMGGRCGSLNFYSPTLSTIVHTIDVTNQNFIGGSRKTTLSYTQYKVTHAILSENNRFLFTVEQSFKNQFSRIRAWWMDDSIRKYVIKYCIESGHSSIINHINSYLDKSSLDVLISTSNDGFVKFWQPIEVDSNVGIYEWSFMNQISSKGKLPDFTEISISQNIVVISYKNTVAFHDLRYLNKLDEINTEDVSSIVILPNTHVNLVILSCKNRITLYNYVEGIFIWSGSVIPSCVAFDPFSSNICVFEKSTNDGMILTIHELQNFETLQIIKLKSVRDVVSCVVGKKCTNEQQRLHLGSHIYFMSSDRDVYLISEDDVRLSKYNQYLRDVTVNKNAELFESRLNECKSNLLARYSTIKRERQFIKMLKATQSQHLPPPENLLTHYLNVICYYDKEENESKHEQEMEKYASR